MAAGGLFQEVETNKPDSVSQSKVQAHGEAIAKSPARNVSHVSDGKQPAGDVRGGHVVSA